MPRTDAEIDALGLQTTRRYQVTWSWLQSYFQPRRPQLQIQTQWTNTQTPTQPRPTTPTLRLQTTHLPPWAFCLRAWSPIANICYIYTDIVESHGGSSAALSVSLRAFLVCQHCTHTNEYTQLNWGWTAPHSALRTAGEASLNRLMKFHAASERRCPLPLCFRLVFGFARLTAFYFNFIVWAVLFTFLWRVKLVK